MKDNPLQIIRSTITSQFRSGKSSYLLQKMEDLKYQRVGLYQLFRRRPLLGISLVGLAIRFALAPFFGHPYDLRIFMGVSWAVAQGISPYGQYVLHEIFQSMHHPHLYGSFYGIGYPPPWGLVLGLMYQVSSLINPNDIYTLVLSLKIPIIVSDLVTSLVLYKILELKLNKQTAFKAFCLYQLCPFTIVIGAVWGMFDVLVFLLTLLSAYLLLEKLEWSLISLAFACSLKPYPIVLAPLYSIFIYKQTHSLKRSFGYSFGVTGLLSLITMIPMAVFKWPVSNLYHALASHMSATNLYYNGEASYTYSAASPFNIYNVFKLIDPSISPPWTLNYLWIIAMVSLYYHAIRRISEVNFTSIINWSFLASLTFSTTRFWVSEQNLILLFSFFLLVVLFNKTRTSWKYIHTLWILFFTFVLIHVPANAFNWITSPQTLNTAPLGDLLGPFSWILMSALTFTWLTLLWNYAINTFTWLTLKWNYAIKRMVWQ
ncbi:MAG: hypothetical protein NWF13_05690 [Candidatus Bathyarchaeota archaeon]|nr:hypothetical protein [Candidatus Bathyarchaeota archaeon]